MKKNITQKVAFLLILLSFFTLSCSSEKKDDSTTVAALALLATRSGSVATAKVPSSLAYVDGSNYSSTTGSHRLVVGSSSYATPSYAENSGASVTGATVVYSVSPSLPSGLTLNTSTGSITGTPTAIQSLTSYTVTATFTASSGYQLSSSTPLTATLKIIVLIALPSSLTLSSVSAGSNGNVVVLLGSSVTITVATTAVSNTTVVYSISPSLPTGLTFDTATGTITGTPASAQVLTTYTVSGTYTAQSGYELSGTTSVVRGTTKIYVNTSTAIANATCSFVGTGGGCSSSIPYSCTSSGSCSSSCASSAFCIR